MRVTRVTGARVRVGVRINDNVWDSVMFMIVLVVSDNVSGKC